MRFYRLVFNRDEKVTFVTMGLNEKKKFKMAPNLTQIKIPKSESSSPAQCPQDYLCQIWCNCDERKYAQKCEKWHFFLNTENVVDAKFKDRNRDTNCSTLSVIAVVYGSEQFFASFQSTWPWHDLDLDFQGQDHEALIETYLTKKRSLTYHIPLRRYMHLKFLHII